MTPSKSALPVSLPQPLRHTQTPGSSSRRRPELLDESPAQSSGATTPTRRLSSSFFRRVNDGESSSSTAGADSPLGESKEDPPRPATPSVALDEHRFRSPHVASTIPEGSRPGDITLDVGGLIDGMEESPGPDIESGFEQSYNLPEDDLRPPSQLLGPLTPSSPMIHPPRTKSQRSLSSQVTPSKSAYSHRAAPVEGISHDPASFSEIAAADEVGEPPPCSSPAKGSVYRSQTDLPMNGAARVVLSSRPQSSSPVALAADPALLHAPPALEPPRPLAIPVDPALEQFRTVRTFRTRTTLQLQPYTRERQMYEAVLRRGGLKNCRNAIAPSKEISKSSEDEDEEVQQSSSSSASEVARHAESAERIVIGNTPPPKQKRRREPVPLTDADYDEYFLEHGSVADEDDPTAVKKLQKIARARLKAEKEERKKQRQAEKARREFERLIRSDAQRESSSDDEVSAELSRPLTIIADPSSQSLRGL